MERIHDTLVSTPLHGKTALPWLVISLLALESAQVVAGPTGGVVTAGNASIQSSGTTTTITQTSNKAAINWVSFNVGKNESVRFVQPGAQSITLNRVVGNERSVIEGALKANGQVWILNSNGVLFSQSASINTAGLLASTMQLTDQRFMEGRFQFTSSGSAAAVSNLGAIQILPGGYAILAAKEVENAGHMVVAKGQVHLVGADGVSIQIEGNSLLGLTVDRSVLNALVQNQGAIEANGGAIYLTANGINELLAGVVNTRGVLRADSLDGVSGKIVAFAHGGLTRADGTLSAQGGMVETSGARVEFASAMDLQAKHWLIDPNNIQIVSDATAQANVSETSANPYLYSSSDDTTLLRASTIKAKLDAGTSVTVQTGTGGTNAQDGNITVSSAISKTSGGDATLTLKAAKSVILDGAAISSSSGKLHTVLWARANGNDAGTDTEYGGVWLKQGSSITTNGGDVTMGGGTNPLTGYAVGAVLTGVTGENNSQYRGVSINGSTVQAGGGNIVINGKGGTSGISAARGVSIGGTLATTGTGSIQITGVGRGSSDGVALGDSALGLHGTVSSQNGNISIIGSKGTGANGVNIATTASTISTTGTGAVSLQSTAGTIGLGGNVSTQGGSITLNSAAALTQGAGRLSGGALNLAGASTTYTLANTSNNMGSVTGTVAGLTYVNSSTLSLGTVAATASVDVATLSGNLNVVGTVSTTSTASDAMSLNAGKSSASATATGGDVIIASGATLTTGSGGRATIYTGSIAGSTGVGTLVGTGSGKFRYNSDESTTNYTTALGSGTYAVYRERPTLTVSANNQSLVYGATPSAPTTTITGYQNGDTAAQAVSTSATVAIGGSTSSAGYYTAGSHALSASGAAGGLGYAFAYASGALTVTPKTLTVTGFQAANKIYDGGTAATVTSLGTLSGVVGGDTVGHSGATFSDGNVGTGKTVTPILTGADAGNYTVASTATASITPQVIASPAPATPSPTPSPSSTPVKDITQIGNENKSASVVKTLDERIEEILKDEKYKNQNTVFKTVKEKQAIRRERDRFRAQMDIFGGMFGLTEEAKYDNETNSPRFLKLYAPVTDENVNVELIKVYKDFGYTPRELSKFAGFGGAELRKAGFTKGELKDIAPKELVRAGFTANEMMDLRLSVRTLYDAGISIKQLTNAGVPLKDIVAAGVNASILREQENFSIKELRDAGSSYVNLRLAGATAKELLDAGASLKDLRGARFPAVELKNMGYSFEELKQAGFSLGELKSAGATAADVYKLGISATEALNCCGWSLKDLKEAGYSASTLGDIIRKRNSDALNERFRDHRNNMSPLEFLLAFDRLVISKWIELRSLGYTEEELKAAGYSGQDIK